MALLPATFLVNPGDKRAMEFGKKARRGIYQWVKDHYLLFREFFADGTHPGSKVLTNGSILHYHVFGDYQVASVERNPLVNVATGPFYPRRNVGDTLPVRRTFQQWLDNYYGYLSWRADPTINLGILESTYAEFPTVARGGNPYLEQDLENGGQSTFFLLPSLGTMLVSNAMYSGDFLNKITEYFAECLSTLADEENKHRDRLTPQRNYPPVFDEDGSKYLMFEHLHSMFEERLGDLNRYSDYDSVLDQNDAERLAVQLTAARDRATAKLKETFDDGTLGSFEYQGHGRFKSAMEEYLKPILKPMKDVLPTGQLVIVTNRNDKKMAGMSNDVKEGQWRVTSSTPGKKKKKPTLNLTSEVDPSKDITNLALGSVFIPPEVEDLRPSRMHGNHPYMAVLALFADVFFFYDSITLLALNKVNQGQFSADTVPRVDSLDTSFYHNNDGTPVGDFFAEIRADHMAAFYTNMYSIFPSMRKQLEDLFIKSDLALAEVRWYSNAVGNYLNPVLIPQMQNMGLQAGAMSSIVMPQIDATVVVKPEEVFYNLESPLLKDTYLAYMREFNDWFAGVVVGANRGVLYAQPYGPEGPGGKKAEKKVQKARQDYDRVLDKAWESVTTSVLSLFSLPNVQPEDIFDSIQTATGIVRDEVNTATPFLPITIDPTNPTRQSLENYLDYIKKVHNQDPRFIAALANAAEVVRVRSLQTLKETQDLFMQEFNKHRKMRAFGLSRFPATAILIKVMRQALSVPPNERAQFVAEQLNDDMRAELATRIATPETPLTAAAPEPSVSPIVPPVPVLQRREVP